MKLSSRVSPSAFAASRIGGRERKLPRSGRTSVAGGLLGLALLRAEDLEVGVPEAVDRLVLVADGEEARLGPAKLLDQVELDAVRVLELVDHQVLEAPVPQRRGPPAEVAKELDGVDLEVGEVEARADCA